MSPESPKHPERPKPPEKAAKPKEDLSFAALKNELGDLPGTPPPGVSREERETPPEEERVFQPGRRTAPPARKDELNARVLTGSAPKSKPMWVKGLWPGAAGLLLCIMIFTYGGIETLQPYFSYGVMVIGGFTMIWGADGLRRSDWPPKERYLCAVPFFMGLLALVIAFFSR